MFFFPSLIRLLWLWAHYEIAFILLGKYLCCLQLTTKGDIYKLWNELLLLEENLPKEYWVLEANFNTICYQEKKGRVVHQIGIIK